jgi:hypothetical protein
VVKKILACPNREIWNSSRGGGVHCPVQLFRFAKSTEMEWNSGQKVGKMKTFTVDSSLLGSRKLLVFQDSNDSTAVARIVYVETGLSAFKALHVEEVDYFPASRKAHFRTREDWYVLGIKIFTHGKTYNYPLS